MKFRPVILVEGAYKFLAKVLTLRMRKVVGKVVSPSQHVFIHGNQIFGHQILLTALIANVCIDFYLKWNQ